MRKIAVITGKLGQSIPWLRPSALEAPEGYTVDFLCCDFGLNADALKGYDAVLNAMGEYFEETSAAAFCAYYKDGGTIISLGPDALTVPYVLRGGETVVLPKQVDLLRSLGCVDLYIPLEIDRQACRASAEPQYEVLAEIFSRCGDAESFRTANYNLGRGCSEDDTADEPDLYLCGRIVPIVTLLADGDHVKAHPIVKTYRLGEGSMLYFNFTSAEFWSHENTQRAFWQLVQDEVENSYAVYAESTFARYQPGEKIALLADVHNTNRLTQMESVSAHISVCRADAFQSGAWMSAAETDVILTCGQTTEISLAGLPEGAYRVTVSVNQISKVITGFYVLSDRAIAQAQKSFPRMVVDPKRSTEFHTQGGEVAPIHGTTYFVTDTYRSCFMHMNASVLNEELARLESDGFNLIRAGMWMHNLAFYGPNGEIDERGMRALHAFFYAALRHGITVQFVMGNVELNNWDTEKSALHNESIRKKGFRVLERFFREFGSYPNVQLDIINEPSYSIRVPWTTGRPSHDPEELKNWRTWLSGRYHGDISALRANWGRCAGQYADFDQLPLPDDRCFTREYNRTTDYEFHAITSDFFRFAQEYYSRWCRSIRELAHRYAPDMVVLMGRDESVRIPCQQDEFFAGNLDTINWHQWQQNGIVFAEYILNKVPNSICCGQELGVYQMENHRGFKRLTPEQIGAVLERKLLYAFGNWVQWQSVNDPYMGLISENGLGIYRADKTETPGLLLSRALAAIEQKMAPHMAGPDSVDSRIVVVHPTSSHFSCDQPIAVESVRTAIDNLGYGLKEHFVVALEHTLAHYRAESGVLYIVPSAYTLRQETWALLLELAKSGNSVLITGSVEQDEYYLPKPRMTAIDPELHVECLHSVEETDAGSVSFRHIANYCDTMHVLDKCVKPDKRNTLYEYPIGKGTLYFHPLPLEQADDKSLCANLYREVLEKCGLTNKTFRLLKGAENRGVLVRAQRFEGSVVYTLVNEGETASIRLQDTETGKILDCTLDAGHGMKLWLSHDGELLGTYAGGNSRLHKV